MGSGRTRVEINQKAIAEMMGNIQREVDKHRITVPVNAEVTPAAAQTVTNYNGPIYLTTGDNAQVAFGSGSTQARSDVQSVSPGYEKLAEAVTALVEHLEDHLSPDEAQAARETAEEVLREVTSPAPERTTVEKLVTGLKGLLASLAVGLGQGTGAEGVAWAREFIGRLTDALT